MSKIQKFTRLENLADIIMGQSPDSSSCTTEEHGLPFLQGCAEFGKQSPITEIYCFLPLRISKPESILISVRAPVGKLNWSDRSYCIGRGLGTVKAKSRISDTRFLGYAIEQNVSFLHRRSQGSTFLAVGSNDLKTFPIPVFSYDKQKKIALILNTIDRTIAKTEALIEKYQQIKAGLMHDLFTRGIGVDGKLRPPREEAPELYQDSAIGWIPKEWEVKIISQVFSIQLGKMLSPAAKTGKFECSYLNNKSVQWDQVNVEQLESMDFYPEEREKFKLLYGDLLVCEGGDVGRTAMWRNDLDNCFFQKTIHRLRPINDEVLPEFMLRYMWYAKKTGIFNNFTSQTSIAHLTREKLSMVNVFVLNIAEQKQLIKQFNSIDNKISDESTLLEKLQKQKSGLMQDLLTGKVSVNVDSDAP